MTKKEFIELIGENPEDVLGGRVMPREMYSPKALKVKVKNKEYEVKDSYFGKENDYKLYYFLI